MNQSLAKPSNKLKPCCSSAASSSPDVCFHCGEPIPEFSNISVEVAGVKKSVCCHGCKSAAQFICEQSLDQFYRHRQTASSRQNNSAVAKSAKGGTSNVASSKRVAEQKHWQNLDKQEAAQRYVSIDEGGKRQLTIAVQGLYCSSCSWLIDSGLKALSSDIKVRVDINANIVYVELLDNEIKVSEVFNVISSLGYEPSPVSVQNIGALQQSSIDAERKLYLKRLAVAGLGMMQVMTYAVAGYLGEYHGIDADLNRFFSLVSMLVATAVVFYSGSLFFKNAWNDLKNRHLGMDVPIALAIGGAYFPSVYLTLTNSTGHIYFDSAVMFVFFLLLGRYLEMRARFRLSETPIALMRLLPSFIEVNRTTHNISETCLIPPNEVKKGDRMELRTQDSVPFDAVLLQGESYVDESLLTGEAEPQVKKVGDQLLAGSRIVSGHATVRAVNDWAESSIARLEQLLRQGQEVKNQQHAFLSNIGRVFIAAVLLLTVVVGVFWSVYDSSKVFHVALAMLIAACPCAFSLAFPVGVTAASNALRKHGILLANSSVLQTIADIDVWCFDKTGTLTQGQCEIAKVEPLADLSVSECLSISAALESHSQHALAYAFRNIESRAIASEFVDVVGSGISAVIDGQRYWLGKQEWVLANCGCLDTTCVTYDIPQALSLQSHSELLLANSQGRLAVILIADKVRDSAKPFISKLKQNGKRVMILSGDGQSAVTSVGNYLGAEQALGRLHPSDKVDKVNALQKEGQQVLMLGDGVNDAQVLQQANISIVMASGSELSKSQADVVLLNGRFEQLPKLLSVADRTDSITRQNLLWALGYNLVALPLAASGLLTPWIAALGMSSSSLIVVLNALRISKATEG